MIYKAIIEKRINDYSYVVRIPRFHKSKDSPTAVSSKDLPTAYVCMIPGIYPSYDLGDIVFVCLENEEIGKPIIIGKLFREDDKKESTCDIDCMTFNCKEDYSTDQQMLNNLGQIIAGIGG